MSIEGAKDVALELNSLSKSSNMAGWRIGMLVGAEERINEVLRFKSNMDSGMFLPAQLAAAKALQLDQSWYQELNGIYNERRALVFEIMNLLGCIYKKNQVGLFVWAKVPDSYESGYALSDEILNQSRVFITPGGIFGTAGNSYIRISLCASVEVLQEAIERIKEVKETN
ncbi:Glutamate-pyruvate aminotransferase AlaC [compost metagenome]